VGATGHRRHRHSAGLNRGGDGLREAPPRWWRDPRQVPTPMII
jgi:hypothetical protein